MTVLVDTNILLDVLQQRTPHDAPATRVWKLVEERSIAGYVSAISFNNVFYVTRKQGGAARALDGVRLIRKAFQLVALDEGVVDAAIATMTTDLEDAIQSVAAARISADYIVTRNVDDFTGSAVPAVTAEELLALLP
jgi:predicted nucleic acid-binding protein